MQVPHGLWGSGEHLHFVQCVEHRRVKDPSVCSPGWSLFQLLILHLVHLQSRVGTLAKEAKSIRKASCTWIKHQAHTGTHSHGARIDSGVSFPSTGTALHVLKSFSRRCHCPTGLNYSLWHLWGKSRTSFSQTGDTTNQKSRFQISSWIFNSSRNSLDLL